VLKQAKYAIVIDRTSATLRSLVWGM